MQNEEQIIKQVKGLLPYFVSIQKWSDGKITDFDYGQLIQEGIWEATLVLWNGATLEFTANSAAELYDTVEETIESLNLN